MLMKRFFGILVLVAMSVDQHNRRWESNFFHNALTDEDIHNAHFYSRFVDRISNAYQKLFGTCNMARNFS